jgi:hypothetical protein
VNATEHTACTQNRLKPEQQQLVTNHTHIVPAIAKQLMKRFSLPSWEFLLRARVDHYAIQ